MTATLMALYRRPDGDEALATFRRRYASEHLPLVRQTPGLRSLHVARVTEAWGQSDLEMVARMVFDDRAALDAGLASDAMRAAGRNLREIAPGLATTVIVEPDDEMEAEESRMTVHYEAVGRRATIRLDRPDVLNALDRPTLDALAHHMRQASTDDRVGVVVLTGTGERAFSTGADLAEQAAFLERPNDYWAWMGHFIAAIDAIRTCPKPVVARLNGMTVGGGNELNLACDLAVAADDVVFRHVGPSRGSVPAGGATQWLSLLIGDRRAREVLLLNQPISAQQALEWGWINRAVPRAELDATVDELCEELLAKLPEVVRATKDAARLLARPVVEPDHPACPGVADAPRRVRRGA